MYVLPFFWAIFAWYSTIEHAARVFGRNLWVVTTLPLQLWRHLALGLVSRSWAEHVTIPKNTQEDSSILYINWTYHPNGLQRTDLHRAFKTYFQDSLPYDRMQVAVAHPKNLRDILKERQPHSRDILTLIN